MSYNKLYISQNIVFFDNQYFFPTQVEPSFVAPILPNFEDLSSFEWFKLDIVYERRRPTLLLPKATPRPETALEATFTHPYKYVLWRFTWISHPLNRYGFSTTLSIINVSSCYKLSSINVNRKQCRRNFRLFKIIIHGKLFIFLQLLSPLGVNGCTQLSFTLMEPWIDIHGWLIIRISKSIKWTMRRLALIEKYGTFTWYVLLYISGV